MLFPFVKGELIAKAGHVANVGGGASFDQGIGGAVLVSFNGVNVFNVDKQAGDSFGNIGFADFGKVLHRASVGGLVVGSRNARLNPAGASVQGGKFQC